MLPRLLLVLSPIVFLAAPQAQAPNVSAVVPWEKARLSSHPWGDMRLFFTGETYAAKDLFTAVMVVKPGEAVHRAHQHAEEEFMVLTEGSGQWHLDGKEFPAQKGDVVYAAPWAMHGLLNTGDKPLTFFVIKYNPKGMKAAERR